MNPQSFCKTAAPPTGLPLEYADVCLSCTSAFLFCSYRLDLFNSEFCGWGPPYIAQKNSPIWTISAKQQPHVKACSQFQPQVLPLWKPGSKIRERVCVAQFDSFNDEGSRVMPSQVWLLWLHLWMMQQLWKAGVIVGEVITGRGVGWWLISHKGSSRARISKHLL